MLVTSLAILVTNIPYLLRSISEGTNMKKMSLSFKFCHQGSVSVTNIDKLPPTLSHPHPNVTNITVACWLQSHKRISVTDKMSPLSQLCHQHPKIVTKNFGFFFEFQTTNFLTLMTLIVWKWVEIGRFDFRHLNSIFGFASWFWLIVTTHVKTLSRLYPETITLRRFHSFIFRLIDF